MKVAFFSRPRGSWAGNFTGNWAWVLLLGWPLQDMSEIFGGGSLGAKALWFPPQLLVYFILELSAESSMLSVCACVQYVCSMWIKPYLCQKFVSRHNITRMQNAFITTRILFVIEYIESLWASKSWRYPVMSQNCSSRYLIFIPFLLSAL